VEVNNSIHVTNGNSGRNPFYSGLISSKVTCCKLHDLSLTSLIKSRTLQFHTPNELLTELSPNLIENVLKHQNKSEDH